MKMEMISKVTLTVFDALRDEKDAQNIITKIDEAECDADLKVGLKDAVEYMKKHDMALVAEDVSKRLKWFM